MSEPAPPISPADADPRLERRDRAKEARLEDVISARRQLREVRRKTAERREDPQRRYSRSNANSEYLGALQDLIIELEPFYYRLGVRPEYWEADRDPVLAVLERPALNIDDVMEPDPSLHATNGYPRLHNPEVLDAETLGSIRCLPDLLEFEDARVSWQVTLKTKSRQPDHNGTGPKTYGGQFVIPRTYLDRARRWCVEFMEKAGLSLGSDDDRDRGRMGGVKHGG